MFPYTLTTLTTIVTGVGAAVVEDVEAECGSIDRVCLLVPGEIAWDQCDCGQFAQTITGIVGSSGFPTPALDTKQTPCGPNEVIISVTESLVRCVPGPDDNGEPPTCAALLDSAITLECDRYVMRHATRCYLKSLYDAYSITGFSVGNATAVGPSGLCVGVELSYSFGLSYHGCC